MDLRNNRNITTNLCIAFFFNLLVAVIVLATTRLAYASNDDYSLSLMIAKDGYFFVRYIDYFLCKLIFTLQQIFPFWNMFVAFQLFVSFVSFCMISYIFLDQSESKRSMALGLSIPIIFAYNHYMLIQFSTTSALLIITGCLLLAHTLLEKKNVASIIVAFLFIYLGASLRFPNVYAGGAFLGFFLMICLIARLREKEVAFTEWRGAAVKALREWVTRKNALKLILIVSLFFGVFIVQDISDDLYSKSEAREAYLSFNSARSQFFDRPHLEYEEAPEFYQRLGYSENDYDLLIHHYLDADTIANPDKLEEIAAVSKGEYESVWEAARRLGGLILGRIIRMEPDGYYILILMITALIGHMTLGRKWLWFMFPIGVMTVLLYYYLCYVGRPIPRAVYIIDLWAVVFLFYSIRGVAFKGAIEEVIKRKKNLRMRITGLLMTLLILSTIGMFLLNPVPEYKPISGTQELWNYIENNRKTLFVASSVANRRLYTRSPYYDNPLLLISKDFSDNMVGFGGWSAESEYKNRKLQSFGVRNLFGDIVDNPNIVVLTYENEYVEKMETFFNKYYGQGERIELTLVKSMHHYKLWSVKRI